MSDLNMIWALADELRGHMGRPDLQSLIKEANRRGIKCTHSDLRVLSARFPRWEFYVPEVLPRFVSRCLSEEHMPRILDPSAGIGGFIDEVAQATHAKEAVAIIPIVWGNFFVPIDELLSGAMNQMRERKEL